MNINLWFTTPFIDISTGLDISSLQSYTEYVKRTMPSRNRSNYGGTQYNLDHKHETLHELSDLILKTMTTVIDLYKITDEYKPILEEMWLNVNPLGGSNKPHIHTSFFSGCFYIKTPENSGSIIFINPSNAFDYHSCDTYKEYNRFNSARHIYNPTPGSLLMFPSWITHFVEPNLSHEERMSIAFNIQLEKINE